MLVVATVINIVRTVILIMTRTVAFEANWTSISDSRAWLLVIFSACRLSIDSNFKCKILRPAHPGGVGSYGRLGGLTGCPESKLRNSVGLSCAVLVSRSHNSSCQGTHGHQVHLRLDDDDDDDDDDDSLYFKTMSIKAT